jgi:ubiquinone/menaquinone biosynthesis C-methylase UbiE
MQTTDDKLRINIDHYRTDDALETYSHYNLMYEEKYLIPKYFSPHSSVLDLACGAGRTTVRLYEMGYRVKGVDLSEILINAAKKRFPHIPFIVGSYCGLNEDDNSFDNILVSYNGLDYAYPEQERMKAVAGFARILKKGGYLIFSTHNLRYFRSAFLPLNAHRLFMMKNIINSFLKRKYIYEPHTGLWTFYASADYIKSEVEKHGFELKEITGSRPLKKLSKLIPAIRNENIVKYISPWLNYVFMRK